MGAEQSHEPATSHETTPYIASETYGYRVMKIYPGSPAHRASLQPYDDIILTTNNTPVTSHPSSLGTFLRSHESQQVNLGVWSVIDNTLRNVALVPMAWNGPGLLGGAVRWERVQGAGDFVVHVVDVFKEGPAEEVGLVPGSDWIVGTPAEAFRSEDQLGKLVANAARKQSTVSLMVYSSATGRVRQVEIAPNSEWGGEGVLGCELATGLLHRIPPRIGNEVR